MVNGPLPNRGGGMAPAWQETRGICRCHRVSRVPSSRARRCVDRVQL